MQAETVFTIILIDDDPLNNLLSKTALKQLIKDPVIYSFTDSQEGLQFISNYAAARDNETIVLLLDVEMPNMDGWGVLEKLTQLKTKIKEHINIFMLSSSLLPSDLEKAQANSLVIDFIEKPLSLEKGKNMLRLLTKMTRAGVSGSH